MTDKEIYAAYTSWQNPFKELFSLYKGKAESKVFGYIVFTNVNDLTDHWGKKKKVECKIEISMSYIVDPKRYSVSAEEKTLEIIGGQLSGNMTKEEALAHAEKMLERYCFKHIEMEQLSLL